MSSVVRFDSFAEKDAAEVGLKEDYANGRLCKGFFDTDSDLINWAEEHRWCPITSIERSTGSFRSQDKARFYYIVDALTAGSSGTRISQKSYDFAIQQVRDAQIGGTR